MEDKIVLELLECYKRCAIKLNRCLTNDERDILVSAFVDGYDLKSQEVKQSVNNLNKKLDELSELQKQSTIRWSK